MDGVASVILHVPERYGAMLAKARRPLLYGAIRDLVRARGGRVVLAAPGIERDDKRQPLQDGNLHIVNNGHVRAPGYLNAATAYLEGYWHLDPRGVQSASSIGLAEFDPHAVDPMSAAAHLADLRARFAARRRSRYQQMAARTDLQPGGIAVFLQGPEPYLRGQAYLDAPEMLRAICAGAGGREVWVKPHPLKVDEGEALIASLRAEGLMIRAVQANVHDLAAAAVVTVSVNSAVAIEGMLHDTPAIVFGRSDFHAAVETVMEADGFPAALERALARPRDYSAFLQWYFQQCLWLGDPGLAGRILAIFAAAGFSADRLGLQPVLP
jgi:hypothetical protein